MGSSLINPLESVRDIAVCLLRSLTGLTLINPSTVSQNIALCLWHVDGFIIDQPIKSARDIAVCLLRTVHGLSTHDECQNISGFSTFYTHHCQPSTVSEHKRFLLRSLALIDGSTHDECQNISGFSYALIHLSTHQQCQNIAVSLTFNHHCQPINSARDIAVCLLRSLPHGLSTHQQCVRETAMF